MRNMIDVNYFGYQKKKEKEKKEKMAYIQQIQLLEDSAWYVVLDDLGPI